MLNIRMASQKDASGSCNRWPGPCSFMLSTGSPKQSQQTCGYMHSTWQSKCSMQLLVPGLRWCPLRPLLMTRSPVTPSTGTILHAQPMSLKRTSRDPLASSTNGCCKPSRALPGPIPHTFKGHCTGAKPRNWLSFTPVPCPTGCYLQNTEGGCHPHCGKRSADL